jgi:malic enzyme
MFLDAAHALAHLVSPVDLSQGAVYPELTRIRDCSHTVACAVVRRAVAEGHASPEMLPGLEETVSRAMWFPKYRPIRYQAGHDPPTERAVEDSHAVLLHADDEPDNTT